MMVLKICFFLSTNFLYIRIKKIQGHVLNWKSKGVYTPKVKTFYTVIQEIIQEKL